MTKIEFKELICLIKALYPNEKAFASEAVGQAWFDVLSDLKADRAIDAVKAHAKECRWPPTISDIRKRAETEFTMTDEEFDRIVQEHSGADTW